MAYNKRTKEFEKFNPTTNVGNGQYSVEEKKKMIRDAGYTGFKPGVNLTDDQFLDLFYREGPGGKMEFKQYLADKYFVKSAASGKPGSAVPTSTSSVSTNGEQAPWG